jgi:hypothetical protein
MMAAMNARLVAQSWCTSVIAAISVSLTVDRSDGRCFPIVTSVLAFFYHAVIAALCSYLPQDLMAIGYGVASYATAACLFSLLGLYGTITVCIRRIR